MTAAAVNARDGCLALGKADGTVELRPALDELQRLFCRDKVRPRRQLVFSPDGSRLAAQNDDGTVVLWAVGERKPCLLRPGIIAEGASLSFSADGQTLASLTRGGPVQFWNTATGEPTSCAGRRRLRNGPAWHFRRRAGYWPPRRSMSSRWCYTIFGRGNVEGR